MDLIKEITNKEIGLPCIVSEFKRFRQAARAVIFDQDNKIALLYVSKNKYHKLPGGGLEEGETAEEALKREAKEEIGCNIIIIHDLGRIIEYKEYEDTGALKHESCGYVAKIVGDKGNHEFTEVEKDLGFEPVEWFDLDEAIKLLETDKTDNYQGKFVLLRDLTFLKEAKKLIEDI